MLQSDEGILKELPLRRRRRGQQRGCGLFDFVKKVIKNLPVKALGQQAIQHLPGLYNAATS